MYRVIGYYKFIPRLWTLYNSFLFLFFDVVVEISPFSTLRIDKLTNVETFFAFLYHFFPFFPSLTSVYLLILRVESYCWTLSHSVTHILILGMTPLDARSARHRAFYLTTRYSQETNFVPPAGFKPTVLANVRPQTYTIVYAATGISFCRHCTKQKVTGNVF